MKRSAVFLAQHASDPKLTASAAGKEKVGAIDAGVLDELRIRYRIDGPAFLYSDHDTGRVATILGYPTDKLSQIA